MATFEQESGTGAATYLWWVILGLVVAFVLLAWVLEGRAQIEKERKEGSVREIVPEELRVSFRGLTATVDYRRRLEVEYRVERSSWERLREREAALWLEVWVPVEMVYRYYVFERVRTVWRIGHREGRLVFPDWVRPETYELIDFCPLVRVARRVDPDDWGEFDEDAGAGWACNGPASVRASNKGPPQVGVGRSFRLVRQDFPLAVNHLYWWAPRGPFLISK